MKASDASVHGILPKLPEAGGGEGASSGDGKNGRVKTLGEFDAALKSGDMDGADTALHSYISQCLAEEDEGGYGDEEEPEDEGEDQE